KSGANVLVFAAPPSEITGAISQHYAQDIVSEVKEAVKEIQRALIASDVELNLVLKLSREIEELASKQPPEGMNQREFILKATYDKLIDLLGGGEKNPVPENPERILMVGLFGSGKTSSIFKVAKYYQKRGKSIGVIAADFSRPAAFEQLEQSLRQVNVPVYGKPELSGKASLHDIRKVIEEGLKEFTGKDLVVCDSAGRSGLDEELKKEIKAIHETFKPRHSWLVLSADIGQAAKKQAKAFKESVGVEGIIISKMDGSAKGGGALAACHETKAPVLFLGVGEKINDLEEFDAARYLQRIMGYGDLQALFERVQEIKLEEELSPEELLEGDFNLMTFKKQLKATKQMGPLGKVAEMLGMKTALPSRELELSEKKMADFEVLMQSMTKKELENPDLLNKQRLERIAKGSGKKEEDVRELLKHFKRMKKMFKQFKEMGRGMKEKDLEKMDLGKMMQKFKGFGHFQRRYPDCLDLCSHCLRHWLPALLYWKDWRRRLKAFHRHYLGFA
ncbi:signal recognition particle receptor subunit alpha, partial [archaeon]|nr:signal recognition particle receptor subunit alpha [archaeon]